MKIDPLEDRVLVQVVENDAQTKGGLFLPDNAVANLKVKKGRVLAVGPGKWMDQTGTRKPMAVQVGQTVLFAQWAGNTVRYFDKDGLVVMGEHEILGIVREP